MSSLERNNEVNKIDESGGKQTSSDLARSVLREWQDLQQNQQELAKNELAKDFAKGHGQPEHLLRLKKGAETPADSGDKKSLVTAHKPYGDTYRAMTGIELLSAICIAAVGLKQLHGNQEKAREIVREQSSKEQDLVDPILQEAMELWGQAYQDPDVKPTAKEEFWGIGEPRKDRIKGQETEQLREIEKEPEVVRAGETKPTAARKTRNEVVVCAFDSNLNFTSIGESVLASWGYKPAELIGRNIMGLLKTENVGPTLEALREILQTKGGLAFENWIRHKDGKWIAISWSAYWSDSDQKIIGVAHDITAAKEAERRRQETVQMVSHDLRSPLTSIQFSLEMLAVGASGELPEEALLDVRSAQNNTTQLINLVNDLLDLEKIEHGMLRMHSGRMLLKDVVQASLESMRFLARSRKIELKAAPTNLVVYADKERLQQVLVNLIANAIKFSPENSTINIDFKETNNMAEVQVIDQGPGIPAACKGEIFERFKQIEGREGAGQKGTGLGLAICKSIIEGHEGEIGVESEEGKGSTFWFRVPLAGKREASPFGSSTPEAPSSNRAAG